MHMTIDRFAEVNANDLFNHAPTLLWCREHCRAMSRQGHMFFMDGQYPELLTDTHYKMKQECSPEFVAAYEEACKLNVEFVMFHCEI